MFSSPQKKEQNKKKKSSHTTKKIKNNKWQDSGTELESDSNLSEKIELKRMGNKRVRRSNEFQLALANAKGSKNLTLLDLGEVNETSKWFEISSASSCGRSYKVEIKEAVSCNCEFFTQKNTPCKHLLYVYLTVLILWETSHILQQMFLTKNELRKIFSGEKIISYPCETKLTTRAKLQSTSTLTRMEVPKQTQVPLHKPLPQKPSMPEPQNDKYWLMKKSGNISKCNGCKEQLGNLVLGRIESDFFPMIQKDDNIKYWSPETSPKYYHPHQACLRKRRPELKLTRDDIKCDSGVTISE